MLIFILFLVGLWLLYPVLARTLGPMIRRWLMRQAVKKFARSAGIDPDRAADFTNEKRTKSKRQKHSSTPPPQRPSTGPIIPPEYAEDVEFTEIRTYSSTIETDFQGIVSSVEEQVSDAEIIEITLNPKDGSSRN